MIKLLLAEANNYKLIWARECKNGIWENGFEWQSKNPPKQDAGLVGREIVKNLYGDKYL